LVLWFLMGKYSQVDGSLTLLKLFSSRVTGILNIALAILLLSCVASFCWQLVAVFRETPLPLATALGKSVRSANSPGASYNVQSLLAVPLFGERQIDALASTATPKDIRRSVLKINVIGLVAGNGDSGVAVLRHGSKTKAYAVGEKIEVPGSVTLIAVMADHIIIENNRKQEKIELDKKEALSGLRTAGSSQRNLDSALNLNIPEIRELIGDPRDTVQNSPLQLVRFFSVTEVFENGRLQGYELKPGRDKRLFDKLSLEPGDIVISLNGQSLSDFPPQALLKLMENTSSFELLVKRADAIITKRFDL
jgi:general secretion pathway protein C